MAQQDAGNGTATQTAGSGAGSQGRIVNDFNIQIATVNGSGSIPPAFGGGEANVHLEEDSVAISLSHGFQ